MNGLDINRGVLTSLDEIFDTRYGLLRSIDIELSKRVLVDDKYWKRYNDEFEYINRNEFKSLYKTRDNRVLRLSPRSAILSLITNELDLLILNQIESGNSPLMKLTINTYPYKLKPEVLERLMYILRNSIKNEYVIIDFIDIDHKDLSLDYIGRNFNSVFMYDYADWLDYQLVANKGEDALFTKFYFPAKLETPIVLDSVDKLEDIFKTLVELYKYVIKCTFQPIELFSKEFK